MPYTEDPADLAGADVAIVGAPTDDLVSDREVIPTAVGSADGTALAADRVVREVVTGIALRRRSGG
jgi:hypothetical protein